ncbi:hypothetical protein A5658_25910 [Mycobacterium sp. 1245111.1]|uniref:hypothetical protein n=1 Tax=Mycobacterium sp. 1245111.1 TaxID=1834073 RepID=UPI0008016E1F|nr:hypothetical protein [Mycobacterium sp. 1245111.1]OBK38789.1 hypothetical protein A5658_25910 [Mycobacterium sp. 1245111.1]
MTVVVIDFAGAKQALDRRNRPRRGRHRHLGLRRRPPIILEKRDGSWDLPDHAGRGIDMVRPIGDTIAGRLRDVLTQFDVSVRGEPARQD